MTTSMKLSKVIHAMFLVLQPGFVASESERNFRSSSSAVTISLSHLTSGLRSNDLSFCFSRHVITICIEVHATTALLIYFHST